MHILRDGDSLNIIGKLEKDDTLFVLGKEGLDMFNEWVIQVWQSGDDLLVSKIEFIRDKPVMEVR